MKSISADPQQAISVLPLHPKETILVMDDQPALCEVADMVLTHCGFRVLKANNADEAKEIVRRVKKIDLLLTDVEMPGMLGDELAEWFRAHKPQAAVVFMSSNPMQRRRLQEYPVIEKPFIHLDVLVNTIRETLRRNRTDYKCTSVAA